jgi:predicted nucleotidyltransferase
VDIESLLRSLNAHDVKYVVIGAMAFPVHGYARATLDTDIFIEPTVENARRCRDALIAFGYDLADCSVDDLLSSKVLIRQYVVACDVHPYVKGVSWSEVWGNRVPGTLGSTDVNFASLADLIRMKEAAGRPKDLEDLKNLRLLWASRPESS